MSKSKKKDKKKFSLKRVAVATAVAVSLLAAGAAGGHAVTISKFNPETAIDNSARIGASLYVQGCIRAAQVILANNPMAMVEVAGKCSEVGGEVYAALKKQITAEILYKSRVPSKEADDTKLGN